MPSGGQRQTLLFQDVESDQTKVTDIFLDEIWDVIVAHEQQVERHVVAVTDQLVLAPRELQPAAHQQVGGCVGQSSGLLHRYLEPWRAHRGVPDELRAPPRCTARPYPPAPSVRQRATRATVVTLTPVSLWISR